MIRKLVVANRGEIALRIMRACEELGIETVALHSEADEDSLHVKFAHETVCIGPASSSRSYLNIHNIISAAEVTGADAVHPGYGFLAENAHFAEVCQTHGLIFVGPEPDMIRRMGDKALARETMIAAGVPVVPGSEGIVADELTALQIAREIGFPVMVKASAGGGGKGMRAAADEEELRRAFGAAQGEAEASFGRGDVYLEKLVLRPRHVEIQVIGDKHGNIVHLGERDCSIQRRHQKLIEESPSPAVDDALRAKMGGAAVRAAEAVNYHSAGTVEFLLDETGRFYFMEMNTRIQVEHPVTEMVTGLDLLKEQIRVAAGEALSFRQGDVVMKGHAIECRINAEDPLNNFAPAPGTVVSFHPPGGPGVRVDTHVYSGYKIPPFYDSMIAKIITYGADRDEAIRRMRRALDECVIDGVPSTLGFHAKIMQHPRFLSGKFSTHFLEEEDWRSAGR
ncbi:MAG: acetyl-CoA carboxylase biotin carboxylase subunit [Candidatus Krumholzibacteriia bacterium]|nr:acetyl-CoA carboxylase biotin carboxylase subunit [bacterium]MCB9515024.1 acetyl-CoA carboxylase biotin carboxylase subunit [Candidatus Latescibacterota bacterium]